MPSFPPCQPHGVRACGVCHPPPPPQRELTMDEKLNMANFPKWAIDAPVTVDACIPIGSIRDFNEVN